MGCDETQKDSGIKFKQNAKGLFKSEIIMHKEITNLIADGLEDTLVNKSWIVKVVERKIKRADVYKDLGSYSETDPW